MQPSYFSWALTPQCLGWFPVWETNPGYTAVKARDPATRDQCYVFIVNVHHFKCVLFKSLENRKETVKQILMDEFIPRQTHLNKVIFILNLKSSQ